jgi:hypothetical protein
MTSIRTPIPNASTPGWNYIPVPEDLTSQVLALVADLMAKRGMGQGPEALVGTDAGHLAPADPAVRGSFSTKVGNANGVWTEEGYAALRSKDTLSAHRAVRIGEALCDAGAGTLVSMGDLVDRTEMSANQVRSALSKLSLFVSVNRDVYPSYVWPFGWYYGREIDPDRPREFHYVMDGAQWEAWDANR